MQPRQLTYLSHGWLEYVLWMRKVYALGVLCGGNTWWGCCRREGGMPPLYRRQDHNIITCATRTSNTTNACITRRRHQPYPSRALLVSPSKHYVSGQVSGFEDEPSEGEAVVRYESSLGWLGAKP